MVNTINQAGVYGMDPVPSLSDTNETLDFDGGTPLADTERYDENAVLPGAANTTMGGQWTAPTTFTAGPNDMNAMQSNMANLNMRGQWADPNVFRAGSTGPNAMLSSGLDSNLGGIDSWSYGQQTVPPPDNNVQQAQYIDYWDPAKWSSDVDEQVAGLRFETQPPNRAYSYSPGLQQIISLPTFALQNAQLPDLSANTDYSPSGSQPALEENSPVPNNNMGGYAYSDGSMAQVDNPTLDEDEYDPLQEPHQGFASSSGLVPAVPALLAAPGPIRTRETSAPRQVSAPYRPRTHHCLSKGCDKVFTAKSSLNEHMRKHTQQTYVCTQSGCGKQLANAKGLRRHLESAHSTDRVRCEHYAVCHYECPKSRAQDNMKRHMLAKH